jgi:hypothetical protein
MIGQHQRGAWLVTLAAAAILMMTMGVRHRSGFSCLRSTLDWTRHRDHQLLRSLWRNFTCGFHIAFLVTHLPGEVDLCGLPPRLPAVAGVIGLSNIVGSRLAGSSTARFRSKYILALMYDGSRALLIGWYLVAPKTSGRSIYFAVGLGLTWLATVPPKAANRGETLGIRYLATRIRWVGFSARIWAGSRSSIG